METTQLLKNLELLSSLSALELVQINRLVQRRDFKAGEAIIREGEDSDVMYIVREGAVRIERQRPDHSRETLARLGVGDHFGEIALIDNNPRSADVVAESDVSLLAIPARDFQNLLQSDIQLQVKIQQAFLQTLCERLRNTNDVLVVSGSARKDA